MRPGFVTFFVILILIPWKSDALSFNFTRFVTNDDNITYEGSAYTANGAIQITTNQEDMSQIASMGRATYHTLLRLWDKASGNLTDFSTHFTFVINAQNRSSFGDGLAFFLAPQGSKFHVNSTKGGSLGLTEDYQFLNTSANTFVAVEFDIFSNPIWDPRGVHAGIDVNSMRSVANISWLGFDAIRFGREIEVWVDYNSSSKNLSAVFTGFDNGTRILQELHFLIDLRTYLPEWVIIGFSGATGNITALHSVTSWDFSSSLDIVESFTIPTHPKPRLNSLVLGLGAGGGTVVVLGLVLASFWLWKRRREKDNEEEGFEFDETMEDEIERGTGPRKFSYKELARATKDFSEDEKLGEGGFGGVYKGFLRESETYIAVKRIARGSKQGIKEYAAEIRIISRLRHRNLVQLLGWCHDKKTLLLVYELMPNGNLSSHLHKHSSQNKLPWGTRYKIAQGLASSLLYLHEEWEQCILHRDLKPSNVMLDSRFNPKLGDFGLARLVDHGNDAQTTIVAGTMGYMAPEYLTACKASKETDVYSFGVVVLEICCGRKPISFMAAEMDEVGLVNWVWSLYGEGRVLEAADKRLDGDFVEEQMERLLRVGIWCAHPDPHFRPSIREAIHVLNFEAPVPMLPLQMPVLAYYGLQSEAESLALLHRHSAEASDKWQTQSSSNAGTSNISTSSGTKSRNSSAHLTDYKVRCHSISKPPSEVLINLAGDRIHAQEIVFEHNLRYCNRCKLHVHDVSTCRKFFEVSCQCRMPFKGKAKSVLQKNEQEWQVVGRKKKGKKPITVHAASVNAKNQETEDVTIEVKEISLPVESALQRKQRKEAEEILEIRELVGIISSVSREEALQSLISYLREEREKDLILREAVISETNFYRLPKYVLRR
ncbi:unnamed protein product [Rhodiola kirilowii]